MLPIPGRLESTPTSLFLNHLNRTWLELLLGRWGTEEFYAVMRHLLQRLKLVNHLSDLLFVFVYQLLVVGHARSHFNFLEK